MLSEAEQRLEREAPLRPVVNTGAVPHVEALDRSTTVQYELWRVHEKRKEELRAKVIAAQLQDCSFKPKLNKVLPTPCALLPALDGVACPCC
jgi:hypothetical protein